MQKRTQEKIKTEIKIMRGLCLQKETCPVRTYELVMLCLRRVVRRGLCNMGDLPFFNQKTNQPQKN